MPLLPDPHDHTIDLLVGEGYGDRPIITFESSAVEYHSASQAYYIISLAALEREGLDGWNLATLKLGIHAGHAASLLSRIHNYMVGVGEDNETRRNVLARRKAEYMSRFTDEWQRGWEERHPKKENT